MGKPANELKRKLRIAISNIGGEVRTYATPGRRGGFDTIIFLPNFLCFAEIKAGNDVMSKLQLIEQNMLNKYGIPNTIIRSEADINLLIYRYLTILKRRRDAAQSDELQGQAERS